MESQQRLVIGVDAGGTKTSAWLGRVCTTQLTGQRTHQQTRQRNQHAESLENSAENFAEARDQVEVLGQGLAGPGNPRAVGFDTATQNMRQAIEAAYAHARCERTPAAALCMGVAGAGRPEEQVRLQTWCMEAGIAQRATATGDARPVLAAAYAQRALSELKGMRGIALICGTGSMAWGCTVANEARSGGWGYLLGDEGSGYWIALEGLRAACRSVDGRGPTTRLLPAFMERLQLSSPAGLIAAIYGEKFDRRKIASLAEVVASAVDCSPNEPQEPNEYGEPNEPQETGEPDEVAATIIDRAAGELSELVLSVAGQLLVGTVPCGTQPWTLAITGGVLLHSASLRGSLQRKLNSSAAVTIIPVADPVQGALYLAANLLD